MRVKENEVEMRVGDDALHFIAMGMRRASRQFYRTLPTRLTETVQTM